MSFSCPYFEWPDYCRRLDAECVPGRAGCVLRRNSSFIVPVEERVHDRPGDGRPSEGKNKQDSSSSEPDDRRS